MSEQENHNVENTNATTKKKRMHGCLIALIVGIVIVIIGFSVCMATFTLDTK